MSWLSRLLGKSAGPAAFDAPLAPAERLAVVGDVHGCDRLLVRLLQEIDTLDPTPDRLIFVGDFVDRGEDSAGVLARLYDLGRRQGDRLVCLRGNHEEMMLQFIDAPTETAARWMRYGGLQTLASFSIAGVTQTMNEAAAMRARDALVDALGPARIAWLRAMPAQFTSGNVTVVHAGADPAVPIDRQLREVLTWGHPDFRKRPRQDGQWIVHGHTVTDEVSATDGRIAVDTGAYATRRLSAAIIDSRGMVPISVEI